MTMSHLAQVGDARFSRRTRSAEPGSDQQPRVARQVVGRSGSVGDRDVPERELDAWAAMVGTT